MNNLIFSNSIRFVGLLLFQVLVFNHINLFGFINPIVYIVWVFLFPFRKNLYLVLVLSFLLGLSVDFFSDSGGINAAATLFIAFIRLPILRIVLNKSDFDYLSFNLRMVSLNKLFVFITILTFIHHSIIFSLSYFSFQNFISIISNIFLTSVFSIILIILGIILFTKKK
ncbi:MAG: rod shape-determining protein MreD [Lutibacter sp.]|nr:rod shape-determining protein MreD [Lutibacter sp.]